MTIQNPASAASSASSVSNISKKLKLTCCGGTGIVTGANFLLETVAPEQPFRILIDCGLVQGEKLHEQGVVVDANRTPFPFDPKQIDILFVTHSHLDHVGRIPKLVKEGFKGVIYSTPETKMLAEIMLEDSVHLLAKEAEREGVLPLYEENDMKACFPLWQTIPYHTEKSFGPGLKVFLKDAGHVLGSCMYQFTYGSHTMVFTGDIGNSPSPLLRDAEPVTGVDYLLMESVYGDRNHEPKDERDAEFARVVKETIARGGALVIPAFSLERTQVIVYELNKLIESKQIPSISVYVDSPLAIKVTEIYRKLATQDFNERAKQVILAGDDVFRFPHLHFTSSTDESKAILNQPNPKIIIAGAGMSTGGRIIHHEKNYLPDPQSTILLVGYEASGTLGRQLADGVKNVKIFGDEIRVAARIENISGFSSHKDSDHLVQFVETGAHTLKKVFVTMGETKSSLFLVQKLRDQLGVDAVAPTLGESFLLDF